MTEKVQPQYSIEVKNLYKAYGKTKVLEGIDPAVERGTMLALLGSNGAGKPTTGLDPRSRLAMWAIIKKLLAGGTTILLTTATEQ